MCIRDRIVTIGGMVGKVVHVTGDKLTFETGEDRVRIENTKWAVSSTEGKGANKETSDAEESRGNLSHRTPAYKNCRLYTSRCV